MRKLFVFGLKGTGNAPNLVRFNLRYGGLVPALDTSFVESMASANNNQSYFIGPLVKPDNTAMLFVNGQRSDAYNFWIWPDINDPTTRQAPVANFTSYIYGAAASNKYFAVAGSSPKLMVFDWEDLSLQTVDVTGLGSRVYSADFSPDGSKLVVVHDSSPYLRVYDTSDWSYSDSPESNTSSQPRGVAFTGDGTAIIVTGSSAPYLAAVSVDMSTVLYSSNDSTRRVNYSNKGIYRHPESLTRVLVAHNYNSTYKGLFEFDVSDNSIHDIADGAWSDAAYDAMERRIYACIYSNNDSDALLRVFDMDTHDEIVDDEFSNFFLKLSCTGKDKSGICIVNAGLYRLSGTVRDVSNGPAGRQVRVFRSDTGELAATTMSDGTTGDYEVFLPDAGPFDVQFRTADGELLNDLFYARAIPEAVT